MATTTARTRTREEIIESPEVANAEIAETLAEVTKIEMPVIAEPPDDLVVLPGGLLLKNQLMTTAIVRELNGRDEEALARASASANPTHFIDRLLRCGTVRIGDLPEIETEATLTELLIGDREMLIMEIRRATYGNEIDIPDWTCFNCNAKAELSLQLEDIPVVRLTNPEEEFEFDVALKRGSVAHCRLANGADQLAMYEKNDLNVAQRETILLSRCIEYIKDAQGHESYMASRPSMALELSMPDRHACLKEINSRQPGPKYNQVKYVCENCGEEQFITIMIHHLFLDLGWIRGY